MYPECIPNVSWCISNVFYMLCYIPREFTCILHIVHVFHTYPKRVQDTFWDTHEIHYDTCILGASLVSHWIHVRIHQDTCILDSFHHDTSGYTEIQNHDTCILDASWRIYVGYMQGFMRDTCGIHVSAVVPGYIEDTCGIHQGFTSWETCISNVCREVRIWGARYMRDTCRIHVSSYILRGDQDTYRIHPRYIVRYIVRYMMKYYVN